MIKAKNGIVKLRGNAIDLFSELGIITKALRYELKEEVTEENFDAMLQTICDYTKYTDEQLLSKRRKVTSNNN
jgi:hypothetical protein